MLAKTKPICLKEVVTVPWPLANAQFQLIVRFVTEVLGDFLKKDHFV